MHVTQLVLRRGILFNSATHIPYPAWFMGMFAGCGTWIMESDEITLLGFQS
jgi:hypothetical protein